MFIASDVFIRFFSFIYKEAINLWITVILIAIPIYVIYIFIGNTADQQNLDIAFFSRCAIRELPMFTITIFGERPPSQTRKDSSMVGSNEAGIDASAPACR